MSGTIEISNITSGIDSILAERDKNIKVYNMNGYKVYEGAAAEMADKRLVRGVYIVRQDASVRKFAVK